MINWYLGIGDLGIGDWGLGVGPNPQSPIPNPQSPIPHPHSPTPNPQSPIPTHNKIFFNKFKYEIIKNIFYFKLILI
jgi:hypothetical protein